MKLVTLSCLVLIAWHSAAQPEVRAGDAARPLAATVTRDGRIVSVTVEAPRALRFAIPGESGPQTHDVELTTLPEDARVVAARLGAFGEQGLAAALTIETGAGTEYRWLYTASDPLRGAVFARSFDQQTPTQKFDHWSLSGPLFHSTGTPYRLVDIHNPGGDSLELTFRRGELQNVRQRSHGLALDERVLHDVCPVPLVQGASGSSVAVDVERVVEVK